MPSTRGWRSPRAVHDHALLFESIAGLLAAGRVGFAVVAAPTKLHLSAVEELPAAGVSVLTEKPLAAETARQIGDICAEAGVTAAVGHVERCNPALQAMRRRLLSGQLGRLFTVPTIRSGPSRPVSRMWGWSRIFATHDIDLVSWLSDSRISTVATGADPAPHWSAARGPGASQRRACNSGAAFNMVVDWVSPTKSLAVRGDAGFDRRADSAPRSAASAVRAPTAD